MRSTPTWRWRRIWRGPESEVRLDNGFAEVDPLDHLARRVAQTCEPETVVATLLGQAYAAVFDEQLHNPADADLFFVVEALEPTSELVAALNFPCHRCDNAIQGIIRQEL